MGDPDGRAVPSPLLPLLLALHVAGLAVAVVHQEWLAGAVVAAGTLRLLVRLRDRLRAQGRPPGSRPPADRPPGRPRGAWWLPGTRPAL